MEEFYLASNGAGRMHCALWEPESAPRAVVQIIHGIAEHIGRYDHFARFLTQRGFVVCADDHMGHGLSVEAGGIYGYFSGGWLSAVADERTLYEEMKRRYPALPYLMLGHSMGSFLLRTYLYMYPGELFRRDHFRHRLEAGGGAARRAGALQARTASHRGNRLQQASQGADVWGV